MIGSGVDPNLRGMKHITPITFVVCLVLAVVTYAVYKDKSVELNIRELLHLTIKSDRP